MRKKTDSELLNSFAPHAPPNDNVISAHEDVREVFGQAAMALNGIVPEGRYKSLLFTALEETAMWANKAVALHPDSVYPAQDEVTP